MLQEACLQAATSALRAAEIAGLEKASPPIIYIQKAPWDLAVSVSLDLRPLTLLGFPYIPIIGTLGLTLSRGPTCHVEGISWKRNTIVEV